MEEKQIIELPVNVFLGKIGAGSHKPGSGSAVAFQGMLSAQLIKTVIDLSIMRKRFNCKKEDLVFISNEIDTIIYPTLEKLLQEDANQFDKVIIARQKRDKELNIELKSQYAAEAITELKTATEIPIIIAKHSIRLTEFAFFIFDNAMQAVRGDSSVAINGAISAVAGSISIINLNLHYIPSDNWTEKIRDEAEILKKERDRLLNEEGKKQDILKEEADKMHEFHLRINELSQELQLKSKISNNKLEEFVSGVQNAMWDYRDYIWKKNTPDKPMNILDPKKLLEKMGYQYQQHPSLGHHEVAGDIFEVAGVIDSTNKHVSVSEKFSFETIKFTIAHELGHALLHPNMVLHRDRPMDGSKTILSKDFKEVQADKFAAYFLMPKKVIEKSFNERFLTNTFTINQNTSLALGYRISDLRKECNNLRDLTRKLASGEYYNNMPFKSLSKQFNVSIETMAIRLEELGLVSL